MWFQRYLRSPPRIKKRERKQQSSFTHAGNWKTSCYHNGDCPLRSLYLLVQKAHKKCLPVLFLFFLLVWETVICRFTVFLTFFSADIFAHLAMHVCLSEAFPQTICGHAQCVASVIYPPTSITHYSTPCPPLVPVSDVTTLPLPLELNTTRVQPRVWWSQKQERWMAQFFIT